MVNCGFRQLKSGRGGSIDYEKGCEGKIYNNVIINCRFGMRITPDADTTNITYNNQFFYGNAAYILQQFYSVDGVGKAKSGDIMSKTPGDNNPRFLNYNVDQFNYTGLTPPLGVPQMPIAIVTDQGYDFTLL